VVERNLQISCPRPPRAFIFVELWLRGRQRRADDSGLARIFQQRPGTVHGRLLSRSVQATRGASSTTAPAGGLTRVGIGQRRKPSKKKEARLATRPDDGRLRGNRRAERSTVAGDSRSEQEMCPWTTSRARTAMRPVDAFNARGVLEYSSDDEYSDDELAGEEESIDPVAALVRT